MMADLPKDIIIHFALDGDKVVATKSALVRCKDCKWHKGYCTMLVDAYNTSTENDYCSWGKRRENGEVS